MRNSINTIAVVNVVGREDRVNVIGRLVAHCLQLRQQLLCFATASTKPGTPTGVTYSMPFAWLEYMERIAAMPAFHTGGGSLSRGLALVSVSDRSEAA
ncbi:MAG: hypothetical protein R3C05_17815 [Pirellulaceae bacterium]